MPVCDSQQSECCICLQFEASRKNTRSSKDKWIVCDCCCQWFHASCGGFCQSDYMKIAKDNLWLKCVICCVQQLLCSESDKHDSSLVESVISVAKKRITESSSRKVSAKAKKKKSGKGAKVISVESTCSVIESNTVEAKTYNITKFDECSNDITGTVDDADSVVISQYSDNDRFLGSNIAEKCDINELDDCKDHLSGSVDNTDSVVISQYSDIDRILVTDNIENAVEFSSSKRILKQINHYCSGLEIDFAYSLAKVVWLFILTVVKMKIVLLTLYQLSLLVGGGVKHLPLGRGHQTAFIKSIDTSVYARKITELFREKGIE